jgi:hypothetical protein
MLSRRIFWRGIAPTAWLLSLRPARAVTATPRNFFSLHDVEPRAGRSIDNTEAFAKASEIARQQRLGTVWIAPGVYPIHTLQLRDSVMLRGAGREATILEALPGEDPALVAMEPGPVRYTGLVGLSLRGGRRERANNPRQWAMRLVAHPAPIGYPHGGMWNSCFSDIEISHFDRGIALEGAGEGYLLPHQFFSMRDMIVDLAGSASGPHLEMTGQVAQGLFQQCLFDSATDIKGPAIQLSSPSTAGHAPSLHHFDVCTVQSAQIAFLIEGAQNISISNCWFENDRSGVKVAPGSYAINLTGNRFANTGDSAAAIEYEDGTSGTLRGNLYAGARTRQKKRISPNSDVSADQGTSIWGAGQVPDD